MDDKELSKKIRTIYKLPGCGQIFAIFKQLIDSDDPSKWTENFEQSQSKLAEAFDCFKKDKIKEYLENIYKTCCQDDHVAMVQGFNFVVHSRELYFLLKVQASINAPNTSSEDVLRNVTVEVDSLCKDRKELFDIADDMCWWFHPARTADKSWGLEIGKKIFHVILFMLLEPKINFQDKI